MNQRILCIAAGQRAGTTALQKALELTGAVKNYGEIFKPVNASHAFSDFARRDNILLADAMTTKGAIKLTRRYFDWLKEDAGARHMLIDVKFNTWLAISPAWHYPYEEPFFLRQLKRARAIFILVWRENLADQILSAAISQEFGIWHNLDAATPNGRKIAVSLREIKTVATLVCRSEIDMLKHLRSYTDKIVIRYEDLFRDGELSPRFRNEFKTLTGVELESGETGGFRQNTLDKREVIANYDEAAEVIGQVAAKWRSRSLRRRAAGSVRSD